MSAAKNLRKWRIIGLAGALLFIVGVSLEIMKINGLPLREWLGLGKMSLNSFLIAFPGFVMMVVSVICYSLAVIKSKKQ